MEAGQRQRDKTLRRRVESAEALDRRDPHDPVMFEQRVDVSRRETILRSKQASGAPPSTRATPPS